MTAETDNTVCAECGLKPASENDWQHMHEFGTTGIDVCWGQPWCVEPPTPTEVLAHATPNEPVWLFHASGDFGGWWGTCSAPDKRSAIARVRRRMSTLDPRLADIERDVQVWQHDYFTIATGYL